jgi:hypothetical protein
MSAVTVKDEPRPWRQAVAEIAGVALDTRGLLPAGHL